jgi:hypothetical protein
LFSYSLYGITLRSEWQLPYMECSEPRPTVIELRQGDRSVFHAAGLDSAFRSRRETEFDYVRLDDGSHYFCWRGFYEFLVPAEGNRISGRFFEGVSQASFLPYLTVGGLSFCMLNLGVDALHATVVGVNGRALGFLGKSGYGKSSLAGAFLLAGHPLLTDDLLVLRKHVDGFLAYPGPPYIKLSGELAAIGFRDQVETIAKNPRTQNMTMPLNPPNVLAVPIPLKTLYLLNRPGASETDVIDIHELSQRSSLLTLIRNSFNDWVVDPARLNFQLELYTQIASRVPVKLLSYPRRIELLESVRDAILEDCVL